MNHKVIGIIMKIKNIILACAVTGFLAACSGSGGGVAEIHGKNLNLTVSGSRSFNPNVTSGQISYYQMTLTAADLSTPFVSKFDGSAESAQMLGVPIGTDRTILIEAINPNGLVIRRGQKEGVSIVGGQSTTVDIVMNSVPIFTNISDNSKVARNRIQFDIFGEPNSQLKVSEVTTDSETALADVSTDSTWVDTTNTEGAFSLSPAAFSYGLHTFKVCDEETDESSQVEMMLYQPDIRPGIMINSGGRVSQQGDEMVLVLAGQPYFRAVSQGDNNLGNETLLDIVPMIY